MTSWEHVYLDEGGPLLTAAAYADGLFVAGGNYDSSPVSLSAAAPSGPWTELVSTGGSANEYVRGVTFADDTWVMLASNNGGGGDPPTDEVIIYTTGNPVSGSWTRNIYVPVGLGGLPYSISTDGTTFALLTTAGRVDATDTPAGAWDDSTYLYDNATRGVTEGRIIARMDSLWAATVVSSDGGPFDPVFVEVWTASDPLGTWTLQSEIETSDTLESFKKLGSTYVLLFTNSLWTATALDGTWTEELTYSDERPVRDVELVNGEFVGADAGFVTADQIGGPYDRLDDVEDAYEVSPAKFAVSGDEVIAAGYSLILKDDLSSVTATAIYAPGGGGGGEGWGVLLS